jgi:hypothetical protein
MQTDCPPPPSRAARSEYVTLDEATIEDAYAGRIDDFPRECLTPRGALLLHLQRLAMDSVRCLAAAREHRAKADDLEQASRERDEAAAAARDAIELLARTSEQQP